MASSFLLWWTVASALGFGGGLGLAYAAARFLSSVDLPWYIIGATAAIFLIGALPGASIGLAQSVVLRHRLPAWRWVLATSIGGGLGLVAMGALLFMVSGTRIPILVFAASHADSFGTPQVASDLAEAVRGKTPMFVRPLGLAENLALGSFWAVLGAVFGGCMGLLQRRHLRQVGRRILWPLWSAAGLGGGLVLGVGIHGIMRTLAEADVGGLGGANFYTLPSLSVGITITGIVYGVATALALRRASPGPSA